MADQEVAQEPTLREGWGFLIEHPVYSIAVVTFIDYAKEEAGLKLFKTKDDLEKWAKEIANPRH